MDVCNYLRDVCDSGGDCGDCGFGVDDSGFDFVIWLGFFCFCLWFW